VLGQRLTHTRPVSIMRNDSIDINMKKSFADEGTSNPSNNNPE